ncbi:MAG: hypothetical protein ABII27_00955 [bacterium]
MIKEFFSKKIVQIVSVVLGCIIALYTMIYIDVVSRAKEAYMQGEKYWSWSENPQEKKAFLEKELNRRLEELKIKLDKNKLTMEQYENQVDIAKFDYDRNMEESSINMLMYGIKL